MAYIDIIFSAIIAISLAYAIYDYATKAKSDVPLWVWGWISAITIFLVLVGLTIHFYLEISLSKGLSEINYIIIVLAAFVSSPFFIWRTILTSKQTENVQRQTDNAQKQIENTQKQIENTQKTN